LRGYPPILIIGAVAIKQNLPILGALGLVGVGLLALALALRRSDDELVRDAAVRYAEPLGPVTEIRVHGSIVDLEFTSRPVLFAEFRKEGGSWVFSKDLAADFAQRMQDPAMSGEILNHLAKKVADTDNIKVTVKEGIGFKYKVLRDDQGLIAEVDVPFSYPKGGEARGSGLFIETFRYLGGAWQSQSTALLKQGPRPKQ
jgi:hypothetical protein